jgi:hypothetical protein
MRLHQATSYSCADPAKTSVKYNCYRLAISPITHGLQMCSFIGDWNEDLRCHNDCAVRDEHLRTGRTMQCAVRPCSGWVTLRRPCRF